MLTIEGIGISSVYFDSSAVSRWADCEYLEHVAEGLRATQTKVWLSEENFGEISNTGHSGGRPERMRQLYFPLGRVEERISMLPTAREITISDGPVDLVNHKLKRNEANFRGVLAGRLKWHQEWLDANHAFQSAQNDTLFVEARELVEDCLNNVAAESLSDVMRYSSSKIMVRLYKSQLRRGFSGVQTRFPIGRRAHRRALGIIWLTRTWMLREHARHGHYGKKKLSKIPNAQDIKQAIYLPFVDSFVTNDEGLEFLLNELRFWGKLGQKWIGSYERFQAGVLRQGFLEDLP